MKKIAFILIPVILVAYVIWQSAEGSDEYIQSIETHWNDRHDFFRTSEASPFLQNNIPYEPVQFFKPDPKYKVSARLDRLSSRETLKIANSDGTNTTYLKYARANFKLEGKEHSLLILKALGFGSQYFTAFSDETSAITTYGGGRYLDLLIGKSDRVEIDFNKAYNPYCAYVPEYLCPLPPRENFLSVAIEAGEKDF